MCFVKSADICTLSRSAFVFKLYDCPVHASNVIYPMNHGGPATTRRHSIWNILLLSVYTIWLLAGVYSSIDCWVEGFLFDDHFLQASTSSSCLYPENKHIQNMTCTVYGSWNRIAHTYDIFYSYCYVNDVNNCCGYERNAIYNIFKNKSNVSNNN